MNYQSDPTAVGTLIPSPPRLREFAARGLRIPIGEVTLVGDLEIPPDPDGLVIFAHGSGSSRHSPRNQFVARALRDAGSGTFLFDLLTEGEEREDAQTGQLRFDVEFLAERLVRVTRWLSGHPACQGLPLGYFGASTGGAAALIAAANLPSVIRAVISRGGRPDLAANALTQVRAATLLIVGEFDHTVLRLNQRALAYLHCEKNIVVISRATHLFEEPGALERVAEVAAKWFQTMWRQTSALRPLC